MKYFEVGRSGKKIRQAEPAMAWAARGMGCLLLLLVFLNIFGVIH